MTKNGMQNSRFSTQLSGDTDGRLIYALGDIHGRYDLLLEMLSVVVQDVIEMAPTRAPILIFCGDYVDRGPNSSDILSTLVWLHRQSQFEIVSLAGNHDEVFFSILEGKGPFSVQSWLDFGGGETLTSYGLPAGDNIEPREDIDHIRAELLDKVPTAHFLLLKGLEKYVVYGDYAFVHAGFRAGRKLALQTKEDCLWIRKEFLNVTRPFEKFVVHGHTWGSDQPTITPIRIGIDTGAYQTGVLTCLRLYAGLAEVIQVKGESGSLELTEAMSVGDSL